MWEAAAKYDAFFKAECELLNCSITVLLRGRGVNISGGALHSFSQPLCLQSQSCRCCSSLLVFCKHAHFDIQCWRWRDKKGKKQRSDTVMPSENIKLPVTFQSNSSVSNKQSVFFVSVLPLVCVFFLQFPIFSSIDRKEVILLKNLNGCLRLNCANRR